MPTKVFSEQVIDLEPNYVTTTTGGTYGDNEKINVQDGHAININLPQEGDSLSVIVPDTVTTGITALFDAPLKDREGNDETFPQTGGKYEFIRFGANIVVYKVDYNPNDIAPQNVVLMSEFGFIEGDSSASAKNTNDIYWSELKAKYNRLPVKILVDGVYHTNVGFQWLNRIEEVTVHGVADDSAFVCRTSGVIAFRVRGLLTGQRCLGVHTKNMRFAGGWTSANNFEQGNKPNTGITGEATWVWASPYEVLYCETVTSYGDTFEDSQYDGISLPISIGYAHIVNPVVRRCFDDGINPGGSPLDGAQLINNIHIEGADISFCKNTGMHFSGEMQNGSIINSKISRCGKNGLDWIKGGLRIENVEISDIGQPSRLDPDFALYPGDMTNVDGFYESGGGARAANFINSGGATYDKDGIYIKNVKCKNLFDRDDRIQYMLNLLDGTGAGILTNLHAEVYFDNTEIDASSVYSCSNISPLFTGPANNTTLRNIDLSLVADFASDNKGARSQIYAKPLDGYKNKWKLKLNNIGASYAVEVTADNEKDILLELSGITTSGVLVASDNNAIKVISNNNNSKSLTAKRNAIDVTGDNCLILDPILTNCGIRINNSNDTVIRNLTYKGESDQRPSVIDNTVGLGSENVSLTGTTLISQEALDVGVTVNSLIENRGSIKIDSIDAVCDAEVTLFDCSDATGSFYVDGGYVETAGRLLVTSVDGAENTIKCNLRSKRTSGQEIICRSDDAYLDLVIRRDNPYTTAPIQLFQTERCVIKGACIGTTATEAVQDLAPPNNDNDDSQMILIN
jgi:hypothetical protein